MSVLFLQLSDNFNQPVNIPAIHIETDYKDINSLTSWYMVQLQKPGILFPTYTLLDNLENPKVFLNQKGDTVLPSSSESPFSSMCPVNVQRDGSKKYPNHMIKPPHLQLFFKLTQIMELLTLRLRSVTLHNKVTLTGMLFFK